METNLKITVKGIEETLANRIGNAVLGAIRIIEGIDGDLDLRRMYRITVAADYAGELASTVTCPKNMSYTNEEYAIGIAQVMALPYKGGYEFVPVVNAQLANNLVQDNEEGYRSDEFLTTLHFFHHELCHVHDNNKKYDAIENMYPDNAKDHFLLNLSHFVWCEYIANYLSSSTATKTSVEMVLETFIDAVKRTKDDIDREIREYRLDGDLDRLIGIFHRHGHFLAKSAAYVLGYMDGLNMTLEKISTEASKCLSGSYFENTWNEMYSALKNMNNLYPDRWKGLEVFNPLNGVMESYYADMGMILSNRDGGQLYMHIPMKPENTPGF
jgi:hypothetical protein